MKKRVATNAGRFVIDNDLQGTLRGTCHTHTRIRLVDMYEVYMLKDEVEHLRAIAEVDRVASSESTVLGLES